MQTSMTAADHDRLIKTSLMRARQERSRAFYHYFGLIGQAFSIRHAHAKRADALPLAGGACKI